MRNIFKQLGMNKKQRRRARRSYRKNVVNHRKRYLKNMYKQYGSKFFKRR